MHSSSRDTGYYLPYAYNDTKIVLLVRDPSYLYAYWEVSSEKIEEFKKQFGDNTWFNSKPVIKLYNVTKNITKYIDIDAFANNWYIKVDYPNCIYTAELGRIVTNNQFVNIASSNSVHIPKSKPNTVNVVYFANYNDVNNKTMVTINTNLGQYDYASSISNNNADTNIRKNKLGISSAGLSGISSDSFIK